MKIRSKIAILFTIITTAIILLLSGMVYYFANQNAFDDFYKRLELRAHIVAESVKLNNDTSNVYNQLRQQYMERLPEEMEFIIETELMSGEMPSDPYRLHMPQSFYNDLSTSNTAFYRHKNKFYAGIYEVKTDGRHFIVIMKATNEYSLQFLTNLRNLLIGSFLIKAGLVLLIAFYFARKILAPVKDITARAEDISARNLHLRIEPGNGKDEMATLAQTFNKMLARLETSFEVQNNFISNASHELRTPLTTIIGEAELALAKNRSEDDYRTALTVVLRQAERLDKITKSLLSLAQTGFEGEKVTWEKIRIDEMLDDVIETLNHINPKNNISLDYNLMPENEEKLILYGNAKLLHLAFNNIITNAYKYGSNQPVTISIASTQYKIVVFIKDLGIGIPHKEQPYIFDPFFRASNTHRFKGFGIGLPLTRNIILLHNGEIQISSKENEGTIVKVSLPHKP